MPRFTLYRVDTSGNPKSTVSPISADINGINDFRSAVRYGYACVKYNCNHRSEKNCDYLA